MKNAVKKIIVSILQWEAKRVIKKYNPKIIAVTGSVGKKIYNWLVSGRIGGT